jgi:ATP-dependent DNA helicase RecG
MDLQAPVQTLKGIGPSRAAALAREGIASVGDLLLHVPMRYEDRRRITAVAALVPGQTACVQGSLVAARLGRARRMTILECVLDDGTGRLRALWFNQPFLRERLTRGARVVLFGRVEVDPRARGSLTMRSPAHELVDECGNVAVESGRIVPIYERIGTLSGTQLRRLLRPLIAVPPEGEQVDPLPGEVRARLGVVGLAEALRGVHAPDGDADLEALAGARSPGHLRLIIEELFAFQLRLALRGHARRGQAAPAFGVDERARTSCRAVVPFRLTEAQKRVSREIVADLGSTVPMRRLLQGDVGSGKTIVALLATAVVVANGHQVAFMAPTEILAEQHYLNLRRLLAGQPIVVDLLTGAVQGREREAVQARIASGESQLVVGTHALLEPEVRFARLGLAVIDEQHRFGVLQRAGLLGKRVPAVHALVMTATPIPRTLALTVYGDLDVSILDELPPGRSPVETLTASASGRRRAVELVAREIEDGHQAYVVYPLIEESAELEGVRAVTTAFDEWRQALPAARVSLLHGRMSAAEKDAIMAAFARGEVQVLVTTTVIEVGVDVANATVMIVEHAERFGLAQLHQLRGRVGRGVARSVCLLVAHGRLSEVARRRLGAMVETQDGFVIAERDLALRGPGELLGTRQAGLPRLRVARLDRDLGLVEQARAGVRWYLAERGPEAVAAWLEGWPGRSAEESA